MSLVPAAGAAALLPAAASERSGPLLISNRALGLAIRAPSSTLANTAETTCAGDCSLLNAVVLKLSSYSRPPAKRLLTAGVDLAVWPAGGAAAPAIGFPSL